MPNSRKNIIINLQQNQSIKVNKENEYAAKNFSKQIILLKNFNQNFL